MWPGNAVQRGPGESVWVAENLRIGVKSSFYMLRIVPQSAQTLTGCVSISFIGHNVHEAKDYRHNNAFVHGENQNALTHREGECICLTYFRSNKYLCTIFTQIVSVAKHLRIGFGVSFASASGIDKL